ncbi:hypothetical protein GCM10017673_12200 [Streptosporangium violaceochromogenes]|nr:hypothetical protein GCM10017673_12200 [Streptosporangium violaceochromogenes]
MKSAANRPTRPGGRDARLAGPPGDPPAGAPADDAESPGEQTVAFRAIRLGDDGPPPAAGPEPAAKGRAEDTGDTGDTGDAAFPPRADDAFAAFRAAAEAAISSVNEVAEAALRKDDAPRSAVEGTAPPREGTESRPDGVDGAPARGGAVPADRGAETPPRPSGEGVDAPSPADDAFAAFRAAAEAAISSVNEVAEAVLRKDDAVPPLRPGRKEAAGAPRAGAAGAAEGETEESAAEVRPEGAAEDAAGDPVEGADGEDVAPEDTLSDDTLSEDNAEANADRGAENDTETEDDTGEQGGGEDAAPEDAAPEDAAPEDAALEDAGREDVPAEDTGDEEDTARGPKTGRLREVPVPEAVSQALTAALDALREGVSDLTFGLDLPGAEEARRVQDEILAQLDDYVIPRVHMSAAPALVVVAGSTGAGKSTLVNTLAGARVSATGVRRPTTGTPVLACHPDDRRWFAGADLLGGLQRQDGPAAEAEPGGLVLITTERLPPGVALLDTPDIDSVVEEHHEIAHRMLDVADLWIFVTTAARYADAPAWRLLRLAKERGARLAIVLSRVPPKSREVVAKHFTRMLTEYGLGEVDRFVVDESRVTGGMLADHEVAELRLWLTELSVDGRRREEAVRATLSGTLDSFRTRVPALARQLEAQVAFRNDLRGDVDGAYAGALAEIEEATGDGSLLCGETLARWQDFAGTGDLVRALHLRRPGRFAAKANRSAPERAGALKSALRTGLESLVVSTAQAAAEEAAARWLRRPGGESLAAAPGLGQVSEEFSRRTGRAVAGWQEHVVELIRTEGVAKRSVARVVSYDVESLAMIFMVGLLGYGSSGTGGARAGGLPQRLVQALLGAESLRTIGVRARSDLRARIATLFDDETSRYVQVLDAAGIPDESAATRLYQATYNLEVAR